MSMMRFIGPTLTSVLVLASMPAQSTQDTPGESGAQLTKVKCAPCHGTDGRGINKDYASLAGQSAEYLTKQIFAFKTGQRKSALMEPIVQELSAGEVHAVTAHFAKLPPGRTVATDRALAAEGAALYKNGHPGRGIGSCAACHGEKALGSAQTPRLAGQNTGYLEQQLRNFIQKSRTNDLMMHLSLAGMTDREIRAVATHLGALE